MKRHGHSRSAKLRTKTYLSWCGMRQRCNDSNHPSWEEYGARGVTVCKEWDDFRVFLRDMGERPKGLALDRIDNSRGYCKENCRWATLEQQSRNRRSVVFLTLNGRTMCATEWAKETGLHISTITKRKKKGWNDEMALSTRRIFLETGRTFPL